MANVVKLGGTQPAFQITGVLSAKINPGIVALHDNVLNSFTAPALAPFQSIKPAITPVLLVGDLANGVAVSDGSTIQYLGPGAFGAPEPKWKTLNAYSSSNVKYVALSGDLNSGLIAFDGANLHSLSFSASANAWGLMTAPPEGTVTGLAGDPTNGVLLVVTPAPAAPGEPAASQLYYAQGGCTCSWTPVSIAPPGLPILSIAVEQVCGAGTAFVIYGEGQLFTLSLKLTPSTATTAATCVGTLTPKPAPPFIITALAGDPTGCTAAGAASGLIASTANFTTWTVVNAVAPDAAA